jgi:hypothetical protein
MSSKLTPRAFGLVLPLTLALVLGACQKSDDSAAQAPAPGGEAASESAAPATEAAPARADVPADAQFASEDTSLADVQSMKEIATCSLESALDLASGAQNPGSAPNSYLVGRGTHYKLSGFATNKDAGSVPANIRLLLVGAQSYAIAAHTGADRPDVASYFKTPAFAKAGYQADAAFDDVAAGDYEVFAIMGEGNDRLACPTHQTLTVR